MDSFQLLRGDISGWALLLTSGNFMLILLLLLLVLTGLAKKCVDYYQTNVKPFETIPGPQSCHPLLGMLPVLVAGWSDWPNECVRYCQKFKHSTWGGHSPVQGFLFTDSPVICRYMLKDNFENFVKGDYYRSFFRELLGNGIFAADGPVWEAHRKISSRLFSKNQLRYAASVVQSSCQVILQQFVDRIEDEEKKSNHGGGSSSSSSISLDLQELFLQLTMDSAAMVTFGMDLGCVRTGQQPPFAKAFDDLQVLCLQRLLNPFFPIERAFQLTARERRIRACKKIVDDFCTLVVQARRQQVHEGLANERCDLLSLFLLHSKEQEDTAGRRAADEELRDAIVNFLVAGHDTTASALSWTFFELTKRPEVVDKIVAEVNEICGSVDDKENKPDYSYESINKLSYTHAVVMEALRLHCPVPNDGKFCLRADTLPDGTPIPAGTCITFLPLAMGRNKEIWGEDAEQFRPERFLNRTQPSPFEFTTFNAGPRMCLGKNQALMTIKMVMAHLLPRFVFVDKIGHSGAVDWRIVQFLKGEFVVEVSKRP